MVLLASLWIVASLILITVGDFFISLYNIFSKRDEKYNLIDTFLLGLCLILFPLGITSIWMPSDETMMGIYIVLALVYWGIRYKRAGEMLKSLKSSIAKLGTLNFLLMLSAVLAILLIAVWTTYSYDAVNYHYQITTWYEKFFAVPGLVNIESRMGFNSNYFLLSALFSEQSRLGEPVFIIQSLFSAYFICWIIQHIIKSKFEIKGIILLLLFAIFVGIYISDLSISSTDILPSLMAFYLISYLLIYPEKFHQKYLLIFTIPFCMLTLKLSVIPFILLSLYIAYTLLREKKYKTLGVLSVLAIAIVCPWLIRNVIVSGYLIYPLHEIDLFNFDWKAPNFVALLDKEYIEDYGWNSFWVINTMEPYREGLQFEGLLARNKLNLIFASLTLIISYLSLIAPVVVGYILMKDKKINTIHKLTAASIFAVMLLWVLAPDFRFIAGTLFGGVFLMCVFLLRKRDIHLERAGKIILLMFCVALVLSSAKRTFNYFHQIKESGAKRKFSTILFTPYGVKAQRDITIDNFDTYKMGKHTIYLSNEIDNATYDYLPSTFITEPVERIKIRKKFYPIQGVEARGNKLVDGFRPIPDFDKGKWMREKNWWTKE